MDIKPRPNHRIYIDILRKMTPEQKFLKTMELTESVRLLFLEGLRKRFPDKTESEIKNIYLDRMKKCYNRNW